MQRSGCGGVVVGFAVGFAAVLHLFMQRSGRGGVVVGFASKGVPRALLSASPWNVHLLFSCCDDAGRQVGVEVQAGWLEGQAAVRADAEDLDDFVVAAGNQQMMSVSCDHEVSWMAGCACIACLLQCAVLQDLEYGYAVVVKSVGCVEPFAGRVDMDVRTAAGIDFV